jgi:hypothetical protein
MRQSLTVTVLVALLVIPRLVSAQRSPLIPPSVQDAVVNEISGDIAFEHIRWFTHYHRPMGGGEGFEAVAKYVEQKARDYGLEDVRVIRLKSRTPSWSPRLGELTLTEPYVRRLAFTPEVALSMADYSRPVEIAGAELIDVGTGTSDPDYAGKDVTGKVVLATGSLATVMNEAVWKRGALGVVYFTTQRRDFQDQVPWTRIPVQNEDKTKSGTFAFVLSQREGMRLRGELAAAKTPYRVKGRVESTFHEPYSEAIVEAVIKGSAIHDQDVVLTGHLQEERFSANDDASGCANVLEIARALKRLIDDGRLPRPRRDIRFWWVDEISAPEQYFADQPGERAQFLANINQDMVGAKQSVGSRVQFVTRPPASRASALGDVVESIVESLVQGNTAYLSAGQARQSLQNGATPSGGSVATDEQQYSNAVLARLGTRERYDARVIPFHNNTDHQVFNMPTIGIPGVTFTNWPDDYIHSTDDDLWQMDATQLKRNAVAVATSALVLANAGDGDAYALSGEVLGRALARIGRDTATAFALTRTTPAADTRQRAVILVRESAAREQRTLGSLRRLTPGAEASVLAVALKQLPTPDAAEARLRALLDPASAEATAGRPAESASAAQTASPSRVPTLLDDVQGYLDKREKLQRPRTLHPLMAYEVLNFVDGHRSYGDIYRAVSAEADAAGSWYYGLVTAEDVTAYLDSAVKAGIVTVKEP